MPYTMSKASAVLLVGVWGTAAYLHISTTGQAELWRVVVPALAAVLLLEAFLALLPRINALPSVDPGDSEAVLLLAYLLAVSLLTGWAASPQAALAVFCTGAIGAGLNLLRLELACRREK